MGYLIGSNAGQQPQPYPVPVYQPPAYPPAPLQSYPPVSSAGNDRLAQLQLLAQLQAQGTLTDDEFEREKQRLLGG